MKKGEEILGLNNQVYHYLSNNKAFTDGTIELRIKALRAVAIFCASFHTGRFNSTFCNGQIEQLSAKFTDPINDAVDVPGRQLLFLATSLHATGGHTKLMENIASFERDQGAECTLVITEQVPRQVPARIMKDGLFKKVICLGGVTRVACIKEIRNLLTGFGKVYNNQDPHDPAIPIALHGNRPFTIYINHADHVFWLGAQQADRILNIRPYGARLTTDRRSNQVANVVLPIKINTLSALPAKYQARRRLGIAGEAKVFLTISTFYKVVPNKEYNIFKIIDEVITWDADVVYLFVGINKAQYTLLSGKEPPAQVKAVGELESIDDYKAAADFYLEGMPVISLTALIEGAYAGAFPFLIWKPYYTCTWSQDELYFTGIIKHPENKEAYLSAIKNAVQTGLTPGQKQATEQIRERVVQYSSNNYWQQMLGATGPRHQSATDTYLEYSTSEEDILLAEMLYLARSGKKGIEYLMLNVLYDSLTYSEYIRFTFFLNKLLRHSSVYKASAQQLVKKLAKQTFPSITRLFTKRV